MSIIKSEFIKGVKWTSVASLIAIIIGIIQWAIISRYLDAIEIGIYSLTLVITGIFLLIANLGMSNSIIHFQINKKEDMSQVFWFNVWSGMAFYILLYFSAPVLVRLFFDSELNTHDLELCLRLFGLPLVIRPFGEIFYHLFQKDFSFRRLALIDSIISISSSLAMILLITVFGLRIESLIYATIVSAIGFSVTYFYLGIQRYFIPAGSFFRFDKIVKYLRFGIVDLSGGLANHISSNLDKYFISLYFGMEKLGIYELAYRLLVRPVILINPILTNVSFPIFSKIKYKLSEVNEIYLKQIEIISFAIFPLIFGLYGLSYEITHLLYGRGWDEVSSTIRMIWFLALFIAIGNPLGSYILALGSPRYILFLNLSKILITSIIFMALGSKLSFLSLIFVITLATVLLTWPLDFYVRWKLSNMKVDQFLKAFMKNLIGSLLMIGIVLLLKYNLIDLVDKISLLIICTVAGGITYTIFSYFFNSHILGQILRLKGNSK